MWAFRYPSWARNYKHNYTFVMLEFTPKVIYLEEQAYAHQAP